MSTKCNPRVSALLCGVSALAMSATLVTSPARAADEIDTIVVTGYRSSLEAALKQKRSEDTQIDAILAEDVGKFPDLNLSESVQRIPGIAITRDGGEGRQISIRGLGPQFARVRINGMEALTTAGGTDNQGGTNRARAFDFNVFASDLFNSIVVRKTPDASTEEGSLGATVDLATARPFDYKGFTLSASGQGSYNTLASKAAPRGAALISNIWGDGRFGALASISYTKRKLVDIGTSTVRWATGNAFAPGFQSAPAAGPTLAQVNAAYHPRFPRFDSYADDQERIGATGSLQWKPTEQTLVSLDLLYADFKATREEVYLEAPAFSVGGACTAANTATSCGIADINVTNASIDSKNTLVSGTFNDVDLRVEDRFDKLDTKFKQINLNADHELGDFKLHALVGSSSSTHDNPIQTTVTLDQFNVQNYRYDYSQGRVPLLDYGSASLTNPGSWVLTQIRERPQQAKNTYVTGQGDVEYGGFSAFKLKAGFNWKMYKFSSLEYRRSNGTTTNQEAVIPAALLAIPVSSYSRLFNLNTNGLGVPSGGATSWTAPDLKLAQNVLSLYDTSAYGGAFRLGPEPSLGNNRGVREEDTGGYVQASWSAEIASMPFRGNVGVRYVHTGQRSRGYTFVSGAPVAVTAERGFNDTLPSVNLVLEPTNEFVVRFGASKVMGRAELANLTPGATVNVSGANRTVTAGNPSLQPYRAKAYDLSVEYYATTGSILSAALFRKDVGSFVQTLQVTQPFTGNPFGLPDAVATAACGTVAGCSPSASWTFTAPINTPGGTLDGIELGLQQPLKFLPGLLSHTGVLLNATFVKSSIQYLNSAGAVVATGDITGLSRRSYNATFYYEDDRLSARISAAYRSKYFTRYPGQEAGTDFDGTNSTFNLDMSAQYSINKNLKLTFEAINLTDQFQDQFNDSSNRVSFYHHTGREFLLGVRFSY